MPIDFPTSPTTGQVYTYGGRSWVYNGTGWDAPQALSEIGAVRTYADAAARTSAIPSPTEGIYTHLNDIDRLEFWNGSAWRSSSALTLLRTASWTSQTSIALDNIFTSEFDVYKVFVRQGNSTNAGFSLRLRTSASADLSDVSYTAQFIQADNTTVSANRGTDDSFTFTGARTTGDTFSELTIAYPALATRTQFTAVNSDSINTLVLSQHVCQYTPTTSVAGFRVFPRLGTSTGQLEVYGIRK